MSDNKHEKKSLLTDLNEEITKMVMDSVRELLKDDAFRFFPTSRGFSVSINESKLMNSVPEISRQNLAAIVRFTATYVHYLSCHDTESFYDGFKEERQKAEKICEIIRHHDDFSLMLFRCLRLVNFRDGLVEFSKRSILLEDDREYSAEYYDIRFPFVNENGEETIFRMELDNIELENLISYLANILKRGDKK